MDDYGNLRKSSTLNKNHTNGGKPPVRKKNITKWIQQKQTIAKPSKPLVADDTPTRVMKSNLDMKLQNPGRDK
nr:probable mediator of RNA polymerase II transcription subunit 26b [Tanacetum cinerariifolium]